MIRALQSDFCFSADVERLATEIVDGPSLQEPSHIGVVYQQEGGLDKWHFIVLHDLLTKRNFRVA